MEGWPKRPVIYEIYNPVVVNLSGNPAQGRVRWPWPDAFPSQWRLSDPIQSVEFTRDGGELDGTFVDLPGWGFTSFRFSHPNNPYNPNNPNNSVNTNWR